MSGVGQGTGEPRCDCEPEVFADGSKLHEHDCSIYPWCPHEPAYSCMMPCACACALCASLSRAHQ